MRKKKNASPIKVADAEEVQQFAPDQPAPTADAPPERPANPAPPADPEQLQAECDKLREELAAAQEKLLRTRADQQNTLKRAEARSTEAARFANAALVQSLLSVADDFQRTLEHADSSDSVLLEGVRIMGDKFTKALTDHNVETIDAVGKPFDPRFHEAIMQQPSDLPPGTVIQQVQQGYKLHDRVLRPAKVIVAADSDQADEPARAHDGNPEAQPENA
jgi:molecular chaperone GrpE